MRLTATIDLGPPPGGAGAAARRAPPDPAALADELREAVLALGATCVRVEVEQEDEEAWEASFDEVCGECAPGEACGRWARGEYDFGEDLGGSF